MKRLAFFVFLACASLHAIPKTEIPEDSTVVDNSRIDNKVSGDSSASGRSTVDRGVSAQGSTIVDSTVSNTSTGDINARASRVETGVDVDGSTVRNSNLSSNTDVRIDATNSQVRAGAINLGGAESSNVTTNVKASIAAENSIVNVGSVSGEANGVDVTTNVGANVGAKNKVVNIGNVNLGGGGPADYKERRADEPKPSARGGQTSIGNVTIESDRVKEVNTTVGGGAGSVGDRIKTRNLANTYKDEDGVDPSGTKNVYVGRSEAREAERKAKAGGDGSAGNTHVGNTEEDRKIRKVNTVVDN